MISHKSLYKEDDMVSLRGVTLPIEKPEVKRRPRIFLIRSWINWPNWRINPGIICLLIYRALNARTNTERQALWWRYSDGNASLEKGTRSEMGAPLSQHLRGNTISTWMNFDGMLANAFKTMPNYVTRNLERKLRNHLFFFEKRFSNLNTTLAAEIFAAMFDRPQENI